jgi:hypothetical protein
MIVPDDVRDWVRRVLRACNVRTARTLNTMPNTHETALDLAFVAEAGRFAGPVRFASEWIVRIETHFLGGGRHFGPYGMPRRWEIADIGVLLVFRRAGKVVRTKVLLLQSKRLYPAEQEYDEDELADYEIGFARLHSGDGYFPSITEPRVFAFANDSRYQALKVEDRQYQSVREYEERERVPVFYLLYHPPRVPHRVEVPLAGGAPTLKRVKVGARVLPAKDLRASLAGKPTDYTPTYGDLSGIRAAPVLAEAGPGWLVERFIADLAVECRLGHVAVKENDRGLYLIFNRRSGPIAAALSFTFDAPPGAGDD